MAEQSSTVTTFRAFVMLTCVLLIPLAAVCGTSFPAVVKAVQNGRCPTLADFRGLGEIPKRGLNDAPLFVPSRTPAANPAFPAPQPGMPVQPIGRTNAAESSVVPVNYEVSIAAPPGQPTTFAQVKGGENRDFPAAESQGLLQPPSGVQSILAQRGSAVPGGTGGDRSQSSAGVSQMPSYGSSSPDATFKYIQDRLKQLGATYYLLEAWGDRKDAYRFYCQMAIGGNPLVKQSFENVNADPLKAMSEVLEQVEDWRKRG